MPEKTTAQNATDDSQATGGRILPFRLKQPLVGSWVFHSHSNPCRVCATEGATDHMIEPGVWHIRSSNPKRPWYFHEVRLGSVGFTLAEFVRTGGVQDSCTCEHGAIQKSKGRAAHCSHVKVVRYLEAPFASPRPAPDRKEPELFDGDELEACDQTIAPAVTESVAIRRPKWLMAVEEKTPAFYVVYWHDMRRGRDETRIVRQDRFGWKCECSRDRMTPDTYCDHILNVLRFKEL